MTLQNSTATELLQDLLSYPKKLSPKYFYDQRGAELFEQITTQEEYYPTRTEISILETSIQEISSALGNPCILYEFGSGSSQKTGILLRNIPGIKAYVPIDICPDSLEHAVRKLRQDFPHLPIEPIDADFCEPIELTNPIPHQAHEPTSIERVIFFPGSTIGNFTPSEVLHFLKNTAHQLQPQGQLLIGVDLVKDISVLERAYNDAQGTTAAFNLNILHRLNRELGATFDVSQFKHLAYFNPASSRIEMHLMSLKCCQVQIGDQTISFQAGETIHTENSYKYVPRDFIFLIERAGFQFLRYWTDLNHYFGVFLFELNSQFTFSKSITKINDESNTEPNN